MEQEYTEMMRDNDDKPKLSFMLDFPKALAEVAGVMEMGAEKYELHNWKDGGPMRDSIDSLLRHLVAFQNCEDDDPESGLNHLAHVICNAFFILENYHRYGGGIDDRDWEHQDEAQD